MAKKNPENFEQLLEETEAIVERLESGELDLDESLKKYEKGLANLRVCARLIAAAEEKVKVLIETTGGEFKLEDFAADSEAEDPDSEE